MVAVGATITGGSVIPESVHVGVVGDVAGAAGGAAGTDTFGVDTLPAAALVGGNGGDVTLGLLDNDDTLGLAAIPSFSMALVMFDDDTPNLDNSLAVDEPDAVGVDKGANAGDLLLFSGGEAPRAPLTALVTLDGDETDQWVAAGVRKTVCWSCSTKVTFTGGGAMSVRTVR